MTNPIESTFPAVPRGGGARRMAVVWSCTAFVGLVILGVTFMSSAALAHRLGIGTAEEAFVTGRVDQGRSFSVRSGCDEHTRYEVEWDSGSGYFGECTSLATLERGDAVRVYVAPWTAEVSPDRAIGWTLLGYLGGLVAVVAGARGALRYGRLTTGGTGSMVRGRVIESGRNLTTVIPDDDQPDQRRIVLLPAASRLRVGTGDHVRIWSSRRGRSGRRRGPWVVQAAGQVSAATHLWRRGVRP